jgi:hypothetical protein
MWERKGMAQYAELPLLLKSKRDLFSRRKKIKAFCAGLSLDVSVG